MATIKETTKPKKVTLKVIRAWFKDEGFTPRHDIHKMKTAFNRLSTEEGIDGEDLFLLVVSNTPIAGHYTHSYGFHTANGRHLIDTFQEYYYNL